MSAKDFIGKWVLKSDFKCYNLPEGLTPCFKVTHVVRSPNSKTYYLNGMMLGKAKEINTISEEEAQAILEDFNSMKLAEPIESLSKSRTCFSKKTGKAKKRFKTEQEVLASLYEIRHSKPGENFVAYKCHNCNRYHIGSGEDKKSEEPTTNFTSDEKSKL